MWEKPDAGRMGGERDLDGMETKMGRSDELDMGILGVVPGGLYGSRPGRRERSGPRRHSPRDPQFAQRVAGIVATWKARHGFGRYASRSIANTAQRIVFPCSRLDRMMRDAIAAGVPLERVEALGDAIKERAREIHAQKRNLKPAA